MKQAKIKAIGAIAICVAATLAGAAYYTAEQAGVNGRLIAINKAHLIETSDRLRQQLMTIRVGIRQIRDTLPDRTGAPVSPADLAKKLDLLEKQIDEVIVQNEQIKNDIDQNVSDARGSE